MTDSKPQNVTEYIATFPENVQVLLQEVRRAIRETVPDAEEILSYAIPAYKLGGKNLIYFSGAKNHIGIYPFSQAMAEGIAETANYPQSGKGTIRFPLDKPIPYALIAEIVKFRIEERAKTSSSKKD